MKGATEDDKILGLMAYLNGPDGLGLLGLCDDGPSFEGPSLTDIIRAHDPKRP